MSAAGPPKAAAGGGTKDVANDGQRLESGRDGFGGVPRWLLVVAVLALVAAATTTTVVLVSGNDAPEAEPEEDLAATDAADVAEAGETTSTTRPEPPPSRRLSPLTVSASSFSSGSSDTCSNPVSYEPDNAVDGQPLTAWQVTDDGTGQRITFTFPPGTTVTRVGLVAGYAKVDPCDGTDRFVQNHRIRSVGWQLAPGVRETQDLDVNVRQVQYLEVEPVTTRSVTMQIDAIQLGDPSGDTAISEISVLGYTDGDGAGPSSVPTDAGATGPDHGLDAPGLAEAFVDALLNGAADPEDLASQAIVDEVRADPAYGALTGMRGGTARLTGEGCRLGDITWSCSVSVVAPPENGAAMQVEVVISFYPPDVTYDVGSNRAVDPDGSPAETVPPYVSRVILTTS